MTSSSDKKRITVNLEEIDYQIIDTLEGVIANSKSSVIYQMIKEWINQNSDRIMSMWGIDLAGIRRQVVAETKGLSIKKDLDELDKEVINQLPELFETINSISARELAKILDINETSLKRIIFGHRQELLKVDLKIKYENGLFLRE